MNAFTITIQGNYGYSISNSSLESYRFKGQKHTQFFTKICFKTAPAFLSCIIRIEVFPSHYLAPAQTKRQINSCPVAQGFISEQFVDACQNTYSQPFPKNSQLESATTSPKRSKIGTSINPSWLLRLKTPSSGWTSFFLNMNVLLFVLTFPRFRYGTTQQDRFHLLRWIRFDNRSSPTCHQEPTAKSPDFLCEENGRNDSLEKGFKKGETFGTSENIFFWKYEFEFLENVVTSQYWCITV